MRIAVDTNALFTTQAGAARYIRGLIRGLHQVAEPGMDFQNLAWEVENLSFRQPARALKTLYRELVWAKFIAPRLLGQRGAELLHSTGFILITPPPGVKHVATLHDLAVIRYPDRFRPWHKRAARNSLKRLQQVARVICISRFTAEEARALLQLPHSRLEVVYNGCEFHPDAAPAAEQPPDCPVPDEFFLFVGSLEPGKNLALLNQVYCLAEKEGVTLPPVVVVGARWAGLQAEGQSRSDWRYLGRQPDPVLVYLFRRALALVFPSKYEGFGLPVVEAMALGCPVICSPVASLPEVGGEAALFADPNAGAYMRSMQKMANDSRLREELIQRGYSQSAQFSWKRCAQETLAVYRQT